MYGGLTIEVTHVTRGQLCGLSRTRLRAVSLALFCHTNLLAAGSVLSPTDCAAVMAQCSSSSDAAPETPIAPTRAPVASRHSTPPGKGASAYRPQPADD